MSGDVQPRKRKDKKKRKDEDDVKEKTTAIGVTATKMGPDDIQLHVHSDHGTGGHWCAKIFFFSLMAVLAGLIGLILMENRGLSDLDTPLSESRYADYLEGWVEEKRDSHDEHDILESLHELDDHEHDNEPFAEEEDHDDEEEHSNEDTHGSNEEGHESNEDIHESNEDAQGSNEQQNEDGDDDEDIDENKHDNEASDEEPSPNSEMTNSQEDEEDEQENQHEENDDNDDDDENLTDEVHEVVIERYKRELKSVPKAEDSNSEDEGFEDGDDSEDGDDNDVDADERNADTVELDDNSSPFSEEDDDEASYEEVIDNDEGEELHLQKLAAQNEATDENEDDEQPEDSSSLAVKIGVGITLVVVAHLVLVKKPQMTENQTNEHNIEHIEEVSDELNAMKRRLTLVTAEENIPSDVDDEQPIEDEDYEEDEEEYEGEEEEYSEEEVDNVVKDSEIVIKAASGDTFEEMKNLYQPKKSIENETVKPQLVDTTSKTVTANKNNSHVAVDAEEESEEEVEESDEEIEYEVKKSAKVQQIEDDVEYDEEEEENSEEDISEVDDSDLMMRLDSKYGKLPDVQHSDDDEDTGDPWTKIKKSGAQSHDIDEFEEDLRKANSMIEDNPTSALNIFETILQNKPNSSKAWYGKAESLNKLSEIQKSNTLLDMAIEAYIKAIEFGSQLNDDEYKVVAVRCIGRMRFKGQHLNAVSIHKSLIGRFDDNVYYRNQLAVTYLLINRLAEAKYILHQTLLRWRHDGFAAVLYGFVLKNLDKNMEAAITFLREGIDSGAEGTSDGRFYFHLGDALSRLGRNDEAMAVYKEAASKKIFLSEYQRSLYNVNRLQSRPFWDVIETGYEKYFKILELNWEKIRDEGMSVLNEKGFFTDEAENLKDTGDWKQFDLFARGRKVVKHCEKTPFTCKIIDTFPAARFCTRGQVKFSVMHPATHVWPHCGPTNCRIRAHLGLTVPKKTFIRVATKWRSWKEGKFLIFDDSFEHEVWHNGTSVRLILIVDVWHPDLTEDERNNLSPI